MQFRARRLPRSGTHWACVGRSGVRIVCCHHVGSSIAALTSEGFLVVMMIGGAIGFYLGIDTPPWLFMDQMAILQKRFRRKIDTAELLSAVAHFSPR